jgi:hypothetical protein
MANPLPATPAQLVLWRRHKAATTATTKETCTASTMAAAAAGTFTGVGDGAEHNDVKKRVESLGRRI